MKSLLCHQTQQQVFNLQAGTSAPTSNPPSCTPALSRASAAALSPRATFGGAAQHHTNGTQHKMHRGLPSRGAVWLTDVLLTCQPLGRSKHTQEQPGAELSLGHGSSAGAAAPCPNRGTSLGRLPVLPRIPAASPGVHPSLCVSGHSPGKGSQFNLLTPNDIFHHILETWKTLL